MKTVRTYLDGGLEPAEGFILPFIRRKAEAIVKNRGTMDYKTTLQEIVQKNHEETLSYRLKSETGPDHDKRFVMEVLINSNVLAEGEVDIQSLSTRTSKQGVASVLVEFMTSGVEEINRIISRLQQIEGVIDIQRTNG